MGHGGSFNHLGEIKIFILKIKEGKYLSNKKLVVREGFKKGEKFGSLANLGPIPKFILFLKPSVIVIVTIV